jgi:prophage regulatory protein
MHSKFILEGEGFVRLAQIIGPDGPIPVARSTIYAWVKEGRFPAPTALGPGVSAWNVVEVRSFIAKHASKDVANARKSPGS